MMSTRRNPPAARPASADATIADWIAREAIPFSLDAPETVDAAVDRVMASLGDGVALLGFGEALHGGEELLLLRNRLFRRLVEAHGFTAIAIESSFPRARLVDEYVNGRGPDSYETMQDAGFSHGFRGLEANRELVEWMRQYNADPAHPVKLRFYGFDSPTDMIGTESPRQVLIFALDYLGSIDPASGDDRRRRIEPLLGDDAAWANPATMMDPAQAIGLTPAAAALRIETEELIAALQRRRPELVARGGGERYHEAMHHASMARSLLTYHAGLARPSEQRVADLLGIRDAMMADTLAYLVARERDRGRVLAFAHNSHLQRGQAAWKTNWQTGPDLLTWWPAGAHLNELFGARYAAIGSAIGVSDANGISQPETGTLEALVTAAPGPGRFVPTHRGNGSPAPELAAPPVRSGSAKNPSYFPLTTRGLTDFDWLAVLDETTYTRGAPPLPDSTAFPEA